MLLELLLGALTCDDGTVGGQAEGIGFVRVVGPVQVVTASGRSLDLPSASQWRLPCWARSSRGDAVIDMVEIPERGFAGEPQGHTADVTHRDTI